MTATAGGCAWPYGLGAPEKPHGPAAVRGHGDHSERVACGEPPRSHVQNAGGGTGPRTSGSVPPVGWQIGYARRHIRLGRAGFRQGCVSERPVLLGSLLAAVARPAEQEQVVMRIGGR